MLYNNILLETKNEHLKLKKEIIRKEKIMLEQNNNAEEIVLLIKHTPGEGWDAFFQKALIFEGGDLPLEHVVAFCIGFVRGLTGNQEAEAHIVFSVPIRAFVSGVAINFKQGKKAGREKNKEKKIESQI